MWQDRKFNHQEGLTCRIQEDKDNLTIERGRAMERNYLLVLSTLIVFMILSGCASFTSPARNHMLEDNKTYWIDYDASRRGAIFIQKKGDHKTIFCAEPSPDVALEIINKFKADVGVEKVTVGADIEVKESVIQLAKRTQTIMFLRESLYRLCELSLNYQLEKPDMKSLYEQVIASAAKMAQAELENAQQSKLDAETRNLKAKQQLSEWGYKIDLIIAYVDDSGKVNGDRLGKLTKNTGLEESFKKFYAQDVEKLKEALKTRYLSNVDALIKNLTQK